MSEQSKGDDFAEALNAAMAAAINEAKQDIMEKVRTYPSHLRRSRFIDHAPFEDSVVTETDSEKKPAEMPDDPVLVLRPVKPTPGRMTAIQRNGVWYRFYDATIEPKDKGADDE